MQILDLLKKDKAQLKKLKSELKEDYKKKLKAVNHMIDVFGDPDVKSGISDTERAKQVLLDCNDKAYQMNELEECLELEGLDVTRSVIHQAMKRLRESGKMKAFRLNGSNQSVYYMPPEGVDQSAEDYPVRADYRPGVNPKDTANNLKSGYICSIIVIFTALA